MLYEALKLPFMTVLWGSHRKRYVPFLNVSFQVTVAFLPTTVFLFMRGPVRWKLWIVDLSAIEIVYFLPALTFLTALPAPSLSEMVKPGPTVPFSLVPFANPEGGGGGGGGGGGWTVPR